MIICFVILNIECIKLIFFSKFVDVALLTNVCLFSVVVKKVKHDSPLSAEQHFARFRDEAFMFAALVAGLNFLNFYYYFSEKMFDF